MDPDHVDWPRLAALRAVFLQGSGHDRSAMDYWRDDEDLNLYDTWFAERVGWKWDAVLDEMQDAGLLPGGLAVVDWGCGSGIASRRWVARHAAGHVALHDRSARAVAFAARRLRECGYTGDIASAPGFALPRRPFVLLLSHVLNELDGPALDKLLALVAKAEWVVWVESATHAVSRRLSALRDDLRTRRAVLLPCPHDAPCGALLPGSERQWCHHFARPPAHVFTDRGWTLFARRLGIDLRSLPYAFLVLGPGAGSSAYAASGTWMRRLGRARAEKGKTVTDVCEASGIQSLEVKTKDAADLGTWLVNVPASRAVFRCTRRGACGGAPWTAWPGDEKAAR